jgi:site-specific DNA-methyltransferase (adenine-specific)
MANLIVTPPREIGRNPIQTLTRWREEPPSLPNVETVNKRIAMVSLAKLWAGKFGAEKDVVVRAVAAARLTLERRLGELLAQTVRRPHPKGHANIQLIRDELLPEGVTWNASSAAQILAAVPKDWFDKVVEGVANGARRPSLKEVYLEAKRLVAAKSAGNGVPHEAEGIIIGDFREVGQGIPDESVALVFTDPPYDAASLGLYGEAAKLAARVLLPGGSMLAYAPNYALPTVIASCQEHLRYWWTIIVLHSGSHALMREFGVRVGYKPVVWFTKGGRFNKQGVISDVIVGDMEKTEHEWQQGIAEAEAVVKALTSPDDLILDPMCGSGTTLIAARRCGRPWLGIEVKAETASLARERLAGFNSLAPQNSSSLASAW